jgi:hypothetical protein
MTIKEIQLEILKTKLSDPHNYMKIQKLQQNLDDMTHDSIGKNTLIS